MTGAQEWQFYLPDGDRSTGWDNHGYVLQLVCYGFGPDPDSAWQEAMQSSRVPDGYELTDPPRIAVKTHHLRVVNLDPHPWT